MRVRTTKTVDYGPPQKRQGKRGNAIIATIVILLIALFLLSRTRQASGPVFHRETALAR